MTRLAGPALATASLLGGFLGGLVGGPAAGVVAQRLVGAPLATPVPDGLAAPELTACVAIDAAGGDVSGAAFDAAGRVMVTGGEGGDLIVWDLTRGEPVRQLARPARAFADLDVSPDGRSLAVASANASPGVVIFDLATGAARDVEPIPARAVAFDASGTRLAWIRRSAAGHEVCIGRATAGATPHVHPVPMPIDALCWSADGRHVTAMLHRTAIPFTGHWRIAADAPAAVPERRPGLPLGWSAEGEPIVAHHYRLQRGERELGVAATFAVARRGGHVGALGLGPSGDQLVRRWQGGRTDEEVFDLGARARGITLGPDGTLAAADERGRLHLIGPDGARRTVDGHRALGVRELVFSPDSRWIAAASVGAVTFARVDGRDRHVVAGTAAVGTGEAGAEFWIADRRGLWRHLATTGRQLGAVVPWPETAISTRHRDAFGGPDEHARRARSLLRVGFGDELVVRQGETPQMHWFDPRTGRFEQLVDPGLRLPRGGVGEVSWSAAQQLLLTIESSVERIDSGAPQPLPAIDLVKVASHALRVFDAAGRARMSFSLGDAPIALAVSPAGDRHVLATAGGGLLVFRIVDDGQGLERLGEVELAAPVAWIDWLDEDRLLAHDGRALHWYDTATLQHRGAVPLATGDRAAAAAAGAPITGAALSPDRRRLALASGATVRVYAIDAESQPPRRR